MSPNGRHAIPRCGWWCSERTTARAYASASNREEVERYLGVTSPLGGRSALSAEEWPLRVVCANTLRAAQAGASGAYRVVHKDGALNEIGSWLKQAYEGAKGNAARLKEVFERLARRRVKNVEAISAFEIIYPDPVCSNRNGRRAVSMARDEPATHA